jgi:hypothetical protein
MRRIILAAGLCVVVGTPTAARAQRDSTPGRLSVPADVRALVVDRWNGSNVVRGSGQVEIEAGREVPGNVAVSGGPLIIAGHVAGSVLALNADVALRPTARIDGELLVVGGSVDGLALGRVAGVVRVYRAPLAYRQEGDRIIAVADSSRDEESWWRRLERRRSGNRAEVLRVVEAGPYNRVEGLPIGLGPVVHRVAPWGGFDVEAAAVVRTGTSFNSEQGDVGHKLRGEIRFGSERGIGIGARAHSVVDPIEAWRLTNLETALAAFLVRRDYRDYFQRHGTAGYVTLFGAPNLIHTGSYGAERWTSRGVRNPFTLFETDDEWRPNPAVDEGVFHVADVALSWDTRTDPLDPWSGWLINADVEHGRGSIDVPAPATDPRSLGRTGLTTYTRAFFDVRRYNRLGPNAQLNMRVVLGGWLNGDPLPLERRLSVDGPGALPGFDFRSTRGGGRDVATCSSGIGAPGFAADCERIALGQIEYRGDLHLGVMDDVEDYLRHYLSAHGGIAWVLFADAGRGWLLGPEDGGLSYGSHTLPPLSTFRSDLGLGIDFAGIGVYAAKSVSTPSQPVNFVLRLRHRF